MFIQVGVNSHDCRAYTSPFSSNTWVPECLDILRLVILSFHPCMHLSGSNAYIGLYLFFWVVHILLSACEGVRRAIVNHRNGQYRDECQGKETSANRGKRITQDQFKVERIKSYWFKVVRWIPTSLQSGKKRIKISCDTRIDTNKGHDDEYRDSDTDTTVQTLDTLYRWSRV